MTDSPTDTNAANTNDANAPCPPPPQPGPEPSVLFCSSVLYSQSCKATPVEYHPCSAWDVHALQCFAPTNLAYRFAAPPDLPELCRSLLRMRTRYPKALGSMVSQGDQYFIATPSNDTCIRALEVPRASLDCRHEWQAVLNHFTLRERHVAGPRLFQALVLHSADPADGCVLLVSIDHATGDVGACVMLMRAWSAAYRDGSGAAGPCPAGPVAPMKAPVVRQNPEAGTVTRRFHFRGPDFANLKTFIAPDLTTNDVLLAVCVCALGPYHAPDAPGGHARLSLMADVRGRGLPQDFMGNAAVPMSVYVPWDAVRSFDLAAIARAVHEGVGRAVQTVPARYRAEPGAPVADSEPLLVWNSWARARGLLEADFGLGLRQWEWLNSFLLDEVACFLVIPEMAEGGLCLHATLPENQMAYLVRVWEGMIDFHAPSEAA